SIGTTKRWEDKMSVTVERVPNEPIIVATLEGFVSLDTLKELYLRSVELTGDITGHWYRITDVSALNSSFMEVLKMVREASQGLPASSGDPNLTVVLVGANDMARLFADVLRKPQYGGLEIPIFKCMEDALYFVHIDLSQRQRKQARLS